jgi:hypothetical protein
VGQDGRISAVILSVGGFLGIGAKLVEVPYGQLRFEEHTKERTVAAARPATGDAAQMPPGAPTIQSPSPSRPVVLLTQIVLPGATQDSLTALFAFNYRD